MEFRASGFGGLRGRSAEDGSAGQCTVQAGILNGKTLADRKALSNPKAPKGPK